MGDTKSNYSMLASKYSSNKDASKHTKDIFKRVEAAKKQFGDNWRKNPIDINEVVAKLGPVIRQKVTGNRKLVLITKDNIIKTDLLGGYARMQNRITKKYLTNNYVESDDGDKTHLRILKRNEMK